MKKIVILTIILMILGSWSVLCAGPNDTEAEEQLVKFEFIIWLNNSTFQDINYSDVDIIVEFYDDDYIRDVMRCYAMPYPSGNHWYEFEIEYFSLTDE